VANRALSVLGEGPLVVRHRDSNYRFPTRDARPWILAICDDSLYSSVLGLMDPGDYSGLLDRLEDSRIVLGDLRRIACLAVAEAGGRPWPEVLKLIWSVFRAPQGAALLGRLTLSGVRVSDLSLTEYVCAAWAAVTEHASQSDLFKMEARLGAPIPGMPLDDLDDLQDFQEVASRMRSMPGVRVG
jgi:hypothetical protein